jgi:diguanylate cyclase (GGDEF)-like protein
LNKWNYHNFTKEAVENCRQSLLRHNITSLSIASLVAAFLMVLLAFYPRESRDGDTSGYYYTAAVVEIIVFILSRFLQKRKNVAKTQVFAVFLLFFIDTLSFSIFVSVIDSPIQIAIRLLIFFMSFQALFVTNAVYNLIMNISIIVPFAFFESSIKPLPYWEFDVVNLAAVAITCMVFTWYISHVVIKETILRQNIEEDRDRFHEESIRDQLTGLNNRRSFEQSVSFYISVCAHVHQTVCVIMMDVDFFKKYNDFYGHPKGDAVLQSIAACLKRLEEEEHVFAARVGGEEFIVIWTENRVPEAERVALKLRLMIHDLQIPHEKSTVAPFVTASIGLYIMRGGAEDTATELYQNVDTALYEAKENGRDCIFLLDSAASEARPVAIRPPEQAGRGFEA